MTDRAGQVRRSGRLVWIRHPSAGTDSVAEAMCRQIRVLVSDVGPDAIVFHDASQLKGVSPGYVMAFERLERSITDQVDTVVCCIPNLLHRVLAQSVAFFGRNPWQLFDDLDDAREALAVLGVELPDDNGQDVAN